MTSPVLGIESSVTGRRWLHKGAPASRDIVEKMATELGVPLSVARMMNTRGITLDKAPTFLQPTIKDLMPNPSDLLDMDAASERLADAVQAGENVAVYADYDVDGACSGALMTMLLRELGANVIHYIPDRLTEGYGPNPKAIGGLVDRGITLIVCVDCGIMAHEALAVAKGRADVVILDHHKLEGDAPEVRAAVNPNRPDCPSGLTYLCAAGVSFIAAVGLRRELRRRGFFANRPEPDLMKMLDMVALATVCDVVPLVGINRAFVQQGLKVLSQRERPGLTALMDVGGLKGMPSSHTLGFMLGPRINAGGRISEADLGLKLILENSPQEAMDMAERLDSVNRTRQEVEAGVLEEAMDQAARQKQDGNAVLVLAGEGWHPGVVGIVAGRVRERFNRPVCVAGVIGGVGKGSGRSVPGIDLCSSIIAAKKHGIILTGGGHAMAAGFSVEVERVREFQDFLNDRMSAALQLPDAPDVYIEEVMHVGAATIDLTEKMGRMAPFGMGNDEPVVAIREARVVKARRIGKEGTTVQSFLEGSDGRTIKAICFRAKEGPLAELLLNEQGPDISVAGYIRSDTWKGKTSVDLHVVDAAILPG